MPDEPEVTCVDCGQKLSGTEIQVTWTGAARYSECRKRLDRQQNRGLVIPAAGGIQYRWWPGVSYACARQGG